MRRARQATAECQADSVNAAAVPYAPLTAHAAGVVQDVHEQLRAAAAAQPEPAEQLPAESREEYYLLERIVADARRLARVRGSTVVTARDVRDAASKAAGSKVDVSPAAGEPQHMDEIVEELAKLHQAVQELSVGGIARPRVLILAESSGVVARMFRDGGCDVATCDLKPSEDSSIPHYLGPAADIQDMGWDLVVGHPPCTYLANAGAVWLYKDSNRWQQSVELSLIHI